MKHRGLLLFIASCLISGTAFAQNNEQNAVSVKGSIQSDALIPEDDDAIGTEHYSDWGLTNTYAEVHVMSKYVTAGTRFEFLEHPMPGFEKDFKGWGFPFFYATGKLKNVELTVGDFYEQFGSGFILRTYEERSLGIDNSLRGARLVFQPFKGVNVKALGGKQRRYWNHNKSWVYGADVELNIEEWFKNMSEHNTYLMLGGSFVSKHESDEDIMVDAAHKLNLPENVGAYDLRARLQHGNYSFLLEYANKGQDPSFDNKYIYKRGSATLLSASYSKRGMSLLVQAKRSDNMSYRSRRSMNGTSSFINHLPAFTMQQTYALAALYPYATQPMGEWAFQVEAGYNFKRHTALGGKYGTNVKVNYSHIRAIDKDVIGGEGTDGYKSSFFKWGKEVYGSTILLFFLSTDIKFVYMYLSVKGIEQRAPHSLLYFPLECPAGLLSKLVFL
jgi:hypothetical protein